MAEKPAIAFLTVLTIALTILILISILTFGDSASVDRVNPAYKWWNILCAVFDLAIVILDTTVTYLFLFAIIRLKKNMATFQSTSEISHDHHISNQSEHLFRVAKKMFVITFFMWVCTFMVAALHLSDSWSTEMYDLLFSMALYVLPSGI